MDLQQRINAFTKLGDFLNQFITQNAQNSYNNDYLLGFDHQIKLAETNNGWFTKKNILYSLKNWSESLTKAHLENWTFNYNFKTVSPKRVAIITAGNIPLVGFHDFLSVLISGHNVLIKQSTNDKHLLPFLAKYLEVIEPTFKGKIKFTNEKLEDFDAIIATGSNNTARYFEYYFREKPSIIRKNRNSIAILTGAESEEQLTLLSDDIFRYYGLGCRNVSKLFVPKKYDFDAFFKAIYKWHPIIHETKYANNYDYNKAVYLMSEFDMLENGFVIIKEDKNYASPIATIFYETYNSKEELKTKISTDTDKIQCVVSNGFIEQEVKFGQTQNPQLNDYADGVDTVEFLLKI